MHDIVTSWPSSDVTEVVPANQSPRNEFGDGVLSWRSSENDVITFIIIIIIVVVVIGQAYTTIFK